MASLEIALAAALILAGLCFVAAPSSAYAERDIILIDSNQGFTASNGVTSGSGTSNDPYIIEGWSITEKTPVDETYANYPIAIEIMNTDVYVVIRNLEIRAASQGEGIVISNSENIEISSVTIEYGEISLFRCGKVNVHDCTLSSGAVSAYLSSGISVLNNSIDVPSDWNGLGVYLDDCTGITVSGNSISGGEISFANVTHSSVTDNSLDGENAGFSATVFHSLVVSRNIFSDAGISLMAFSAQDYESSIITTDNYAGGEQILVYRGVDGLTLTGTTSQVILIDCHNVDITGAEFSNRTTPITAAGTDGVRISDTVIAGSEIGAFFSECYDVVIEDSVFSSSTKDGILMWRVHGGSITGSLFDRNGEYLGGSGVPDPVQGWTGTPAGYGLYMCYSDGFLIYHNDFYKNTAHAQAQNCTDVRLDAGYDLGGNYWSGYENHDVMAGPYQNVPSPDGIWDRPVELGWNSDVQDNYPSVTPFRTLPEDKVPATSNEGISPVWSLCALLVILVVVVVPIAIVIRKSSKRRPPE